MMSKHSFVIQFEQALEHGEHQVLTIAYDYEG